MKSLLFATQNQNKVLEIQAALQGLYTIKSLDEVGFKGELMEPFDTFEENAAVKARQGYDIFGLPCFAEDAGLVIEALDGRPGVMSARYAGEQKNPKDNIDRVLKELTEKTDRQAYFIAIIAFYDGVKTYFFDGRIDGQILRDCQGQEGFGYDPIFRPDGYELSFGEMHLDQKKLMSHRGIAVRKFISWLKNQS
ncbi:MAG: RdgB/HAM1 family non-canonical purine NTP pyrophosphatase [Saprospiraceae bacterium]|jgi:XTP/dITP diphosphohydrolase|nr:RdgB/HAM1 family non-canonical purine NTP pyrophosphatase [Saprospiraceae bacterium]MBK6481464.1 RdgB/HAM1 family non-canonical purine NTP pyrophosphatase [Saprospiraceae bacterium]MBK7438744.1 RdgB/HAM1 family non-canonical purine NTP pyrophosphatase [Saprospiraceae bacterium]MBK8279158.1 RdgB/HAM1 family non-canonical purine NTP pyrophosphatase [Saprospiraceae bacterium]MBK8777371.1 RdgB/HAM1 family non-canonical purine NTP pyrophosphatase [Saprospiraceae bacterium]